MNLDESIRIAFRSLVANKLRAALTMLGIIIGVGAVITLLSVGQGVDLYVKEQFLNLGSNLLFVLPGQLASQTGPGAFTGQQAASLTMDDANALSDPFRAPDVLAVAPVVLRTLQITAGNRELTSQINGVTPEFESVRSWSPIQGRFITQEEVDSFARVAVIGFDAAERLFPNNPLPIGESIKVRGIPFRVVGIMQERGGSGFGNQDETIFIPLTTAQARLIRSRSVSGSYTVSTIYAQAVSEDRMDAAAEQMAEILRAQHNISFRDDDDFSVVTQTDLVSIFGQITGVLTVFLGAIAAISLLVGGIGIMNIMLVSVTERTKEIGLRKAVGAKRRDIMVQFLIEAVVLSMAGGLIGIAIGAVGALAIGEFVQEFNTFVSPIAIAIATSFSAAVGLFFGIYPATRAASLNPIEALRYE